MAKKPPNPFGPNVPVSTGKPSLPTVKVPGVNAPPKKTPSKKAPPKAMPTVRVPGVNAPVPAKKKPPSKAQKQLNKDVTAKYPLDPQKTLARYGFLGAVAVEKARQQNAIARGVEIGSRVTPLAPGTKQQLQKSGFDLSLGGLSDQLYNLGRGSVVSGFDAAGALLALLSPTATVAQRKKGLKELGKQAAAFPQGIEAVTPNPKSLPLGDVSLVQWDGSVVPKFWVRGGENQDLAVAKQLWEKQTIASALTALGVVAPAVSAGELGAIASRLRSEFPNMGRGEAMRLARQEMKAPGYLSLNGVSETAGIQPRVLKSKVGDKVREVTVPQSRSATGRAMQRYADTLSASRKPGSILSERKRANRAIARAEEQAIHVENARIANLVKPVADMGYKRFNRSNKPVQALMSYVLQTPKTEDALAGPKAVKAHLEKILADNGYKSVEDSDGFLWRGLSPHERDSISAQVSALDTALKNPPDSQQFGQAVDALEQIANASENIGLYVALGRAQGKPPEVAAEIIKSFMDRKNAVAKEVGMAGDARAFVPHQAAEDKSGMAQFLGGTRLPATGNTVGVPKSPVTLKPNKLVLFRGGRLNVDPRVILSTYYKRRKFLWAENKRRDLYHDALPIYEVAASGEKEGYFIRNPDAPPTSMKPSEKLMANVADAQKTATEILDWQDGLDGNFFGSLETWFKDNFIPGTPDKWNLLPTEWTHDIQNVRWLPKDVVQARIKPVFQSKPDGWAAPTLATINGLARLATINGKVGRYITSNTGQDILMAALTNPRAVLRGMGNQASVFRSIDAIDSAWKALRLGDALRARDPNLYELVKTETGDIAGTAGLPEFYVRPQNKAQAAEMKVAQAAHSIGSFEGALADSPYRVAVWQSHARRYGIKTDEQIKALLESNDPAVIRVREQIAQQSRDDMLDFNRMTPEERMGISRFFFIWAFIRASIRYPATFTRDYPIRTAAIASQTLGNDYLGGVPTSSRDLFRMQTGNGEYNAAWAVPFGPAVDFASTGLQTADAIKALAKGDGANFQALAGMLTPSEQMFGQATFGNGITADMIAQNLIPGYAGTRDIIQNGVQGIPTVARFTPSSGERTLSRSTKKQKEADREKINEKIQAGAPVPDLDALKLSFDSYWKYKELEKRATYGAAERGRTKLTDKERALLLHKVAREFYPSLDTYTDAQVRKSQNAQGLADYVKWLRDQMFGARNDVVRYQG